jgi:putative cyclase
VTPRPYLASGGGGMKHLPGESSDVPGLSFAADQLAMNVHSDVDSHIDALCHVSYQETLYNGVAPEAVTSQGASVLSVDEAHDGIVGRGVPLDIPALRGVPWLEPGDWVTAADLAAAQKAQQVEVGPGDLLFVRVGRRAAGVRGGRPLVLPVRHRTAPVA